MQNEGKLYINPNQFGAPLVLTSVKAGFASIMDDKIEKRISMDEILEINSPATFVFRVSGDSMCEVGILDGDYVVIKKTPNANFDDVILAIVDNEFTLKTYKKDAYGAYLKPENPDYPIIRPKYSLSIFGVAIGITRRF
jgi:SOS-response transcriptional repressor LexA